MNKQIQILDLELQLNLSEADSKYEWNNQLDMKEK